MQELKDHRKDINMLPKSIHLFILCFTMITGAIQTTKTAQYPKTPISFLGQYNQEVIPKIQQTVKTILNDYEKNYKNYPNNLNKVQDIFWALKRLKSCMKLNVNIEESDMAPLEKNLADIKKTNNLYTSQTLLKRQRYIDRRLATLTRQIFLSKMVFFDSEEVS